jgi:multiple sugar transport system ATP-binding protein
VRGTVQVVEMLGSEQYVHVALPGGMLTARVTRDRPVKVQENVTLRAAARHLHLFDPAGGVALS